jgi:SAM-dependent methyltransferase
VDGADRLRHPRLNTTGNTAKDYCLRLVAERVEAEPELVVVDLGCGDGRNVEPLLAEHPRLRYLGIDPSADAIARARERLAPYDAQLQTGRAYDVRLADADFVLSFSVLEHVHERAPYVRSIARNLKPDGSALVNYDAGHFAARSERWKGPLRRALAAAGRDAHYQAPVREDEFARLADTAGLQIEESRFFNTHLKELYKLVPDKQRFAEEWLRTELELNEWIAYRDEYAPLLRTRNFVLKRAT